MYHNVIEIESALRNFAAVYPSFAERILLPEPSFEGQQISCLRIGTQDATAADGALFIFGQHAREWVPPEAALAFTADILSAYADNHELTYGGRTYTASQVRQILDTINIFVVACVNPDGRRYTQSSNNYDTRMWRRNRTTVHHPTPRCQGVDLNRNYDFAFKLGKYFSSASDIREHTSEDPCDFNQTYQGPEPFSESETRNVRWLLDTFSRIRWFMDVHGYRGELYYPFGDDENQSADPAMNWRNTVYDHQRGVAGDRYGEYIAADDFASHAQLANRLREGIQPVRGSGYVVTQGFNLYATAGVSRDYAWSRHQVDSAPPRVEAYTIEHIAVGSFLLGFQPDIAEKDEIVSELVSGLINFSLATVFQKPRLVIRDYGYNAGSWKVERHVRHVGDLTGDGRSDIVGFGDAGVYIALNTGHGTFYAPRLMLEDLGYVAGTWRVERHPRLLADLTGDGRADIVGFGDAGVYIALNNGGGTFQPVRLALADLGYVAGSWRVERHPRFPADLTGDGRADIVGFGDAGVYVALNNGDGTFQPLRLAIRDFGYVAGSWRVERHPRFLADLTGDGRADIVGFGDFGVSVALNNGDGTFQPRTLVIEDLGYVAGGWRVERHPRFLADLTGDGRADVVGFGGDGVFVALNNGDGTFQAPQIAVWDLGYDAGGWRVERHPRFLADLTGDGRADIIGFGDAGVIVALNNGDGTFQAPQLVLEDFGYIAGDWNVERHVRFVTELTGDGRADIIGFGNNGVVVALNKLTFL